MTELENVKLVSGSADKGYEDNVFFRNIYYKSVDHINPVSKYKQEFLSGRISINAALAENSKTSNRCYRGFGT